MILAASVAVAECTGWEFTSTTYSKGDMGKDCRLNRKAAAFACLDKLADSSRRNLFDHTSPFVSS